MASPLDAPTGRFRSLLGTALDSLDDATHLEALRAVDRGDVELDLDLTTGAVKVTFVGVAEVSFDLTYE